MLQTLAVAESCTGWLFSHTITNVPGASQIFKGSVIAYTGGAKMDVLGIPTEVLKSSGEVSAEAALEMAKRVAETLGADVGVGITGNAGPTAVQGEVGEVHICVYSQDGTMSKELDLEGSRVAVKLLAVEAALDMLLEFLQVET